MYYVIALAVAAALLTIGLLWLTAFLVRQVLGMTPDAAGTSGGWKWYPSGWGLLVLLALPLTGLLLWRVFPFVLFIPIVLPFFWRWGGGMSWMFPFNESRRRSQEGDEGDVFEGAARPADGE